VDGQNMTLPGNDDTIELVLTPEQLSDLSQAAEEAQVADSDLPRAVVAPAPMLVAPIPVPAVVAIVPDVPPPRAPRWHQTPIAKMAANTLAFVAFAWWSVSQLAGQPQAHPTAPIVAAARPVALVTHPSAATALQQPPMQVVNPFDKTEVFEFPAGTSADEGREKVAQILLQRARERQSRWEHIRPETGLRTASLTGA
jgi:hypothetical protein